MRGREPGAPLRETVGSAQQSRASCLSQSEQRQSRHALTVLITNSIEIFRNKGLLRAARMVVF